MQPTRRPSTVIILLLLLPLLGTGCGVFFTHGPPAGHATLTNFRCTRSVVGPIADIVFATVNMGLALKSASDQYDLEQSNQTLESGFLWGAIAGASAAVGFEKVSKCVAAQRQLAERNAHAPGGSAPTNVQTVEITPAVDTLRTGERLQLVARALNRNGGVFINKAFKWSTSSDAVVSVSDSGLVIARAPGAVVIAANADNVIGTASVVVVSAH